MSSEKIRDPKKDHLLTPENSVFVMIDYQPSQIITTLSMDRQLMIKNMRAMIMIAKNFNLPIVLTTVNHSDGTNSDTIPQLKELLGGVPSIDRTTINSWEDEGFNHAIKATGRKKPIMAALWTDACLLFPALDAWREGYEVYPVVDCVGANSLAGHDAAIHRMVQAGAQPTGWNTINCELQRDWARTATVPGFISASKEEGTGWGWWLTIQEEISAFHHIGKSGEAKPTPDLVNGKPKPELTLR